MVQPPVAPAVCATFDIGQTRSVVQRSPQFCLYGWSMFLAETTRASIVLLTALLSVGGHRSEC